MQYRLRLLSDSGHKLGTFEFERETDSEAIAFAIEHQADGPVDVWAICSDAAWLLYRSRINVDPTSSTEPEILPFVQEAQRVQSQSQFVHRLL